MSPEEAFREAQFVHLYMGTCYLSHSLYNYAIDLKYMHIYFSQKGRNGTYVLHWKPHPLEIPGCYYDYHTGVYKIKTYVMGNPGSMRS